MNKIKKIPIVLIVILFVLWVGGGCSVKASYSKDDIKTTILPLYYIQNRWGLTPLYKVHELTT